MDGKTKTGVLADSAKVTEAPVRARVSKSVKNLQCARERIVSAFRDCQKTGATTTLRKALNQPYEERGVLGELSEDYQQKARELSALLDWFDIAARLGTSEVHLETHARFCGAIEQGAAVVVPPVRTKKPVPACAPPPSAPI
jgi:hypothetical protein